MKFVITVGVIVFAFVILVSSYASTLPISLEDRNIDIVKLAFFAFEEGDFTSLADLYSPDYLQHAPEYVDPVTWTEYELACRIVHARLPDLQYRIVDIFAAGDRVAVRSFWEIPIDPSWSEFKLASIITKGSAISIFRIKDGLIIEEWCEYDPAIIKRFCTAYKSLERLK